MTHELDTPVSGATNWQREVAIAAALLAFGLLALPFAVYFVGQQLLGDYGDGLGALALAETFGSICCRFVCRVGSRVEPLPHDSARAWRAPHLAAQL